MSVWDEYLGLLDELGGLAARETEGIAEADARYQQESRRLQNELAGAERNQKDLETRNRQLQIGIRNLTRQLDVAIPSGSDLPPLASAQLANAMKSAEYDLKQISRSLEFIESQRTPVQVNSQSAMPAALSTATTTPDTGTPVSTARVTNRVAIGISVITMLVVVAIATVLVVF